MVKHARTSSKSSQQHRKRAKPDIDDAPYIDFNRIATVKAADAVTANRPFLKLLDVVKGTVDASQKGNCVVYWMRLSDLRISNNRALSKASEQAQQDNVPLIIVFIHSPQDYIAHDRSARKIDFTLRHLAKLREQLAELNIPLCVATHSERRTLEEFVIQMLQGWNVKQIFGNFEYELDEVRRDLKFCKLAKEAGMRTTLVHDKCVVDPGLCRTKQGKVYTVYSPYQRTWLSILNDNLPYHLEDCPKPAKNGKSIRTHKVFGELFQSSVPDSILGFELDADELARMEDMWPAGEETARLVLDRFLRSKARASQLGGVNPLEPGEERTDKKSRVQAYGNDRDKVHTDSTSRLSPYLAAGVISVRTCILETLKFSKTKKVQGGRDTGIGMWIQELAWRDFYTEVLIEFPRVSMGRPFNEKYADVVWEEDETRLQAWKDGKTGVPIVDAGMRQLKKMGWMHNRTRMITAMFLTKDLMIDWRLGEKHFMEQLIDGDLASNNGGWQWSASTGTDSVPYFRIFNPYTQSQKVDPTGEYIRYYVEELKDVRGPELHQPPTAVAKKLGYPLPIVVHEEARERALRRYKTPGAQ